MSKPCPRRFHVHCLAGRPLPLACSVFWSRSASCLAVLFLLFFPVLVDIGKVLATGHLAWPCTKKQTNKAPNTKRCLMILRRSLVGVCLSPARTRPRPIAINSGSPLLLLLYSLSYLKCVCPFLLPFFLQSSCFLVPRNKHLIGSA